MRSAVGSSLWEARERCLICQFFDIKRSPSGRHLLRRAELLSLLCYQISLKMSIIRPFFVIISSFLICLVFLICVTKKFRILSSRMLVREVSMMRFGLCLRPFFSRCSSVFVDVVWGDLISNSMPLSKISGLFCLFSGKKSTLYPAFAKISVTRNSCCQTFLPAGIKMPFLQFDLAMSVLYHLNF